MKTRFLAHYSDNKFLYKKEMQQSLLITITSRFIDNMFLFYLLQNSFTDIARLLSDFFRDLDVVPSDVVAGLVLLRKFQKIEREANVNQVKLIREICFLENN